MDNSPLLGKSRKTSFDTFFPMEKIEKDYGFNLEQNLKLTESNPETYPIWHWLHFCKTSNQPFEGLLQIIEKSESKSKVQSLFTTYQSEEREKCLKLCEWDFFSSSKSLEDRLSELKSRVPDSKLSMLSIFALNYHSAIQEASESSILSAVLPNFNESDTNFLKMCKSLSKTQSDPFIQASLLFLSGAKNLGRVLASLSTVDSAGLALRYLNDQDLKLHLRSLLVKGEETGDLQALMISGFTSETANLIQKYFERTSDLQTSAILSLFALQVNKSEVLEGLVASYKSHLTRMEMFNLKCHFEIEEAKMLGKKKEKGKSMRCYCCGSSVAVNDVLAGPTKKLDGQSHDQAILNHCPSCPAALARCCVCLISLKPMNPFFINKTGKEVNVGLFVWCEKCHHGGHSAHVFEWFNENSACPVFGCGCPCGSLDQYS